MIEIIILIVIAVWFVFAIKSGKKHKCCGDCCKCSANCKGKADYSK